MTRQYEGGYGCDHCDYTGWLWDGPERSSAGPDPTPYVEPRPCPFCTAPVVPDMDPDNMDDWGMMADSDQDEALLVEVAIG